MGVPTLAWEAGSSLPSRRKARATVTRCSRWSSRADFVRELPEVFLPIPGAGGRMGMTRIPLPQASEVVLAGALRTGWRLRTEKTTSTKGKKRAARRR